jgi:hypothetical protein
MPAEVPSSAEALSTSAFASGSRCHGTGRCAKVLVHIRRGPHELQQRLPQRPRKPALALALFTSGACCTKTRSTPVLRHLISSRAAAVGICRVEVWLGLNQLGSDELARLVGRERRGGSPDVLHARCVVCAQAHAAMRVSANSACNGGCGAARDRFSGRSRVLSRHAQP